MATIPTLLYYFSILLMIEADARRTAADETLPPEGGSHPRQWQPVARRTHPALLVSLHVTGRHRGVHGDRDVGVQGGVLVGVAGDRAQLHSVGDALTPPRLYRVLRTGGRDVLGVAATTATAGIIVGVVTLTGLGLKLAGVIVTLAGGTLALTVVYSAIAVWLLGLAVPVTASYIIAAVMVAPALVRSGVPDFAAHMFIFYYAVLSE